MQLAGLALAATLFVHFRHPASDEPVFALFPEGHSRAGEPDESKPVGVRIYGPGSKEYRATQTALLNEAIERRKKKVTAEAIESNAVKTLARTTFEFVNFTYKAEGDESEGEGQGYSPETAQLFYSDRRYVHLREQVQDAQGDHGRFLPSAANS